MSIVTTALATPGPWRRCGPYVLGRRIGTGGMAAVFAARQEMPSGGGRLVAIKLMSAFLSDDREFRSLFLREATIAMRLEHPNIVRIYDVGEAGGDLFIAMEFVHGVSLAALLHPSGSPMPPMVAARIAHEIARALHAAHELKDAITGELYGLVHQDVSPQNVMVGYDGTVKLLDFGVARIGMEDASRTETLRGKPTYLAPEQLEGARIDRRTDLFALGVVLFELLTGQRLFRRGSIAESHHAILACKIPDLCGLCPGLPPELARIATKLLQRDPEQRFATAQEVRSALVEACAEIGAGMADEATVGTYVSARVPASTSAAELEREIATAAALGVVTEALEASVIDIADMPTMAPKRAAPVRPEAHAELEAADSGRSMVASPSSERAPSRARALALLGLAVAGGTFWFMRARASAPDAHAPGRHLEDASGHDVSVEPPPPPAPPPSATPAVTTDAAPTSAQPAHSASIEILSHRALALPHVTTAAAAPAPVAPAPSAAPVAVPPAPPEPPRMGFLSIRSTPWGHVRIDGTAAGDSPLSKVPLRAGEHTISIQTDDGHQQSKPVIIEPDKDAKVGFTF